MKQDKQTYVEFAREKENLFDGWYLSQKANSKEQLQQLVLLEELKNCLLESVCLYLNEQKAATSDQAAIHADEFALTHRRWTGLLP